MLGYWIFILLLGILFIGGQDSELLQQARLRGLQMCVMTNDCGQRPSYTEFTTDWCKFKGHVVGFFENAI